MDFQQDCQTLFDFYVACYREGDAAGCAAAFSPVAELYSPYGPPAVGRAAIEALHREWVEEEAEDKQITIERSGCSGDLGWCVAQFSEGSAAMGTSLNIL